MAERRMFAKSIVLSDAFLDMPLSTRCLYFTLGMLADDDGFIGNPKSIMRQCGASQDDMLMLIQKRFVLTFDNGVIVIKHWRINNYLQNDRHKDTNYLEELDTLKLDRKGAYTEKTSSCIQNVYTEKKSIGKDSIGYKENYQKKAEEVAAYWNEKAKTCSIRPMQKLTGKRITALKERLKDYSVEDMKKAIDRIVVSDFCNGKGERGWKADIDFLLRPDTITKTLEGKYDNQTTTFASYEQRTESDSNSLKGFRIKKTNVTAEEIRKRLDNH